MAEALRPRRLDEILGQAHLVGPGAPLRRMAEGGRLSSMILWGPPGTGKTTLARLLAATAGYRVETLSAVSSGVKDLREVIARAESALAERGERTVLFIDEVHRFNKAQQDLLLPVTETGLVVLIGATTENPYFEVNAALISRTTQWRLHPLGRDDLVTLVERGAALRGAEVDPEAVDRLVAASDGDGRRALTTLEVALALAGGREDPAFVTGADVSAAVDGRVHHQGLDTHFDQISALIKSVRGSDPDAALFWMSALLAAGESPRFVARRLVILASEDVGLADSRGLVLAEAAARAVEFVGLPEGQLILAHATVALALMDKSNSVTTALGRAQAALEAGASTQVPSYLRSPASREGPSYRYPHDEPSGWVDQAYLDSSVAGRPFYEPTDHGEEIELVRRWRERTRAQGEPEGPPVE